jgi:hypothetical protein
MRDIRVAKRREVGYTCNLHRDAPNVQRCPFYMRLVGGDDDAPVSLSATLGAFWRRRMVIVGTAV